MAGYRFAVFAVVFTIPFISLAVLAQEQAEEPPGEPIGEPEPVEQPTEEPPEQPLEEPVEQPTEEPPLVTPEEPAEQTTEEVLVEPSGDSPKEQSEEETEAPSLEKYEKVEVTGTRIKRANTFDHAQIVIVSSEQIEMSGAQNIEQLLRKLPVFTFQGQKTSHPTGEGVVTVDLRNLGPERNLVLINGHRIVGAGGQAVDMSIIPVSAVDRVEVMLGGASAIYGAGAMTGVINVILKKDFNQIETRVRGGITTQGDGGEVGASTVMGLSRDRGNIMLGLDASHRAPVFQRNRSWANPPCENVFYSLDGSIMSECGSTAVPGGTYTYFPVLNPLFNIEYPNGIVIHGSGENMTFHGMQTVYEVWMNENPGTPYDLYNWGEQTVLSGQSDRINVVTNGEFKFTDSFSAYMDGLFVYQRHGGRWAAEPIRNLSNGGTSVHLSNPFVPDMFWTEILDPYGIDENNPFIGFAKRTSDVGARVFENNSTTFRGILGLRGEITEKFSWDVFAGYSQYGSVNTVTNLINTENFAIALDPDLCYSTPGCVLANIFGAGSMQGDVRDFVGYDGEEIWKWHLINGGAHVLIAPFELPGGSFTAVVGADLQWVLGKSTPTQETIENGSTFGLGELQGNYNSQEAFVELSAPFVSGVPGVSLLELNLTGRYSHYSSFGSHFSFGTGLTYAPVEDLRLRGNWSTSFKVPTLSQLYGGSYVTYPQVNDPCSFYLHSGDPYLISQCQSHGVPDTYVQVTSQFPVQYGSNPNLEPEKSRQFNLGTVFVPTFMPKRVPLIVTFDWYKIWVSDLPNYLSPDGILYYCYTVEGLQEYCDYIEREDNGNITLIDASLKNANELEYVGIDFSASVGFPIYNNINGNVGFQWSILRTFVQKDTDAAAAGMSSDFTEQDLTETIEHYESGTPKHRYLLSFSIGDPTWTAGTQLRYISEMAMSNTSTEGPYHSVPSVAYWDASGRVRLGKFDIVIGIQNILDREPPYFPGTSFNGNPSVYDFIGRYVYANLGYEFL